MSQKPLTATVVTDSPKCPACGAARVTFAEVFGPTGHAQGLQDELSALKQEFEARAAQFGGTPLSPEEEAFLHIVEQPKEARRKLRQQQIEHLQQEFTAAKKVLISQRSGPRHKLAVVFCEGCGHVIGTADPPESREAANDRLERGLDELRQAILGLYAVMAGSMAGVRDQVAALNAREEARERAARLNAAASGLRHLIGE